MSAAEMLSLDKSLSQRPGVVFLQNHFEQEPPVASFEILVGDPEILAECNPEIGFLAASL